jgi:hypothetical protein
MKAEERLKHDRIVASLKRDLGDTTAKYKQAVKVISSIEKELDAKRQITPCNAVAIKPSFNASKSEATAVIMLSDWHYEEEVESRAVSGLNKFTLDIAKRRAEQTFFVAGKMVKIFQRDIPIKEVVIYLGGDFITGSLHEENVETAQLLPITAIMGVQKLIVGGLLYLLGELPNHRFTVICSAGNHSRVTKKQRHATENGNSLETYMYQAIAHTIKNPRIKFVLQEGYLGYLDIYGFTVCFHHGHAIKYGGGIGGLFIPAFKAIGQWNKAKRADWHMFCHFHTQKDGGSFVSNGSLIGYNAYALSIKADYEKPKQLFYLVDKLRGRTVSCPIILD